MASEKHWTIDRKIPIAVLICILIQGGSIVWWGSQVATRLDGVEKWQSANAPIVQKIDRIEERVQGVKEGMTRIEQKLDRVIEEKRR